MFGRLISAVQGYIPYQNQIWNTTIVRTRMRYHFPRPNERQRVVRNGFWNRLRTTAGRKIIMRKILKGRAVLGHSYE